MSQLEPEIKLREDNSVNEECARIMADSEPWLTLKFDFNKIMGILNDPIYDVYTMYIDSELIGFSIVQLKGAFVGYIKTIAIKPAWRNKGFGRKFISYLEEEIFKLYPNVFLCVSSFNKNAERLYKRLGYEQVGELKDYIMTGYSEILLRETTGPITGFQASTNNRK